MSRAMVVFLAVSASCAKPANEDSDRVDDVTSADFVLEAPVYDAGCNVGTEAWEGKIEGDHPWQGNALVFISVRGDRDLSDFEEASRQAASLQRCVTAHVIALGGEYRGGYVVGNIVVALLDFEMAVEIARRVDVMVVAPEGRVRPA